ncbi:MAG: hypothetical protein BEU04_00875 [Marine Group III euryarchaeote CG-Bathy1]|uniref:RNA polymerase Rpb4/RPC9 core domain-containing protein n=1 Tax=Marine Group III euryarchaeote CG-Bathy1 TaxID=1889001 RepID=A0A1J5THD1_9ARCH|nr:MAG: hypothetical protein BEU04_00875 [Marine Group III euryarchaeote CG-Bathy1]
MSEEPQPLTLSEVKILFSEELSRRENRLRCIECGHFQPVPEVEETPETPAPESTDDSEEEVEGPKGPTCDSCGSDRLMLNEQIKYEHNLALDHVQKVSTVNLETSKAIMEGVQDLEHVNAYYATKIADILPQSPDEVRALFSRERFTLGNDEIAQIITAVKDNLGD